MGEGGREGGGRGELLVNKFSAIILVLKCDQHYNAFYKSFGTTISDITNMD